MKSPDRDAADEATDWELSRCRLYGPEAHKMVDELLAKRSELATLRRRVAEMEKALILIGGYPHGSPLTAIGQIARAALAPLPPGRNEG